MKITLEQHDLEAALRNHLKAQGVEVDNIVVKMKRSAQGVFTAVVDTNVQDVPVAEDGQEEEETEGEARSVFA